MSRIAIGSDHAGFDLKSHFIELLSGQRHELIDMGTDGTESVDYPSFCAAVGRAVRDGAADMGIVVGGSGQGEQLAANKVRGVRAAMCLNQTLARYSREHNGANVITLGSTLIEGPAVAIGIVDTWLGTPMREARYIRRLQKIRRMEQLF